MKRLLVFICVSSILVLQGGCTSQRDEELKEQVEKYEQQITELQENIKKYEIDIHYLEAEKDDYKDVIIKTIGFLNEDQIEKVAKNGWYYNVEIDGNPISSSGKVDLDKNDFNISFSERRTIIPNLPEDIYEKASVGGESGSYMEHLKIINIEPNNISTTDGTIATGIVYEFKGVPSGTSFQIKISKELMERVELQRDTIDVHIK